MYAVFAAVPGLEFSEERHTLAIRRFPLLAEYAELPTSVLRQYKQELEARTRMLQVAGAVAAALFGVVAALGVPQLWSFMTSQFDQASGDASVEAHLFHDGLGVAALFAALGLFVAIPGLVAGSAKRWLSRSEVHLSHIDRHLKARERTQVSRSLPALLTRWARLRQRDRNPS